MTREKLAEGLRIEQDIEACKKILEAIELNQGIGIQLPEGRQTRVPFERDELEAMLKKRKRELEAQLGAL